jgi:hypothetical protein
MRNRLEDFIIEKWKLMDVEKALWYCVSFFFGFLFVSGIGVVMAQYSLELATFLFILSGFLLAMSEVLYWKYRALLRKRRIMG